MSQFSRERVVCINQRLDVVVELSNAVVEPGQLYEPPFTGIHFEGLDGAFANGDAEVIVERLETIRLRAA